jgi:hypothetical protein
VRIPKTKAFLELTLVPERDAFKPVVVAEVTPVA